MRQIKIKHRMPNSIEQQESIKKSMIECYTKYTHHNDATTESPWQLKVKEWLFDNIEQPEVIIIELIEELNKLGYCIYNKEEL